MNLILSSLSVPVAQPSQNTLSMGSQLYETNTSPPVLTTSSESQAYGGTTASPDSTTTEWTTEGKPTETNLDQKVVEPQPISESKDVPGSETKIASPGRDLELQKRLRHGVFKQTLSMR